MLFGVKGKKVKMLNKTVLCLLLLTTNAMASDIIGIAQSQIGQGEIGKDNGGPTVRKYTRGQEVPWCAGFVSWVFHTSGRDIPYHLSARSYLRYKRVKSPKAGDLIIFRRGANGGHIGIIESVEDGRITTIEGNKGTYPARVKRFAYTLGHIKNLLGFVRL